VIRDDAGDPVTDDAARRTDYGVLFTADRDVVANNSGVSDLVHVYHPEANPPTFEDQGAREQRSVETVQVDISVTDRNDPDTGMRIASARDRLVGDPAEVEQAQTGGPSGGSLGTESGFTLGGESGASLGDTDATVEGPLPYPGLAGEVRYLLELARRDFREWDVARKDTVNMFLGNSNADMSWSVELEHVAENTADV